MNARRVVVTGAGAVTPLGNDLASTLTALAEPRPMPAPAIVQAFDPRAYFRVPKAIKLTDRPAQFAVAAAAMALDDARWPMAAGTDALGVAIGSSGSNLQAPDLARAIGSDPGERATRDIPYFADRILGGLHPLWLLVNLPNMISAHVAIQFEARGPNTTIMTDWIAGLQAIGEASDWIRRGDADAVLAGGADSGASPFTASCYRQSGLLSDGETDDSRGFVPAEGAAILLLEEREAALRRGAAVLAEVHGYATASAPLEDAGSDGGALAWTIEAALHEAGWTAAPDRIVNASVWSAPFLAAEASALRHALGPLDSARGKPPCTTEHTSRLGHALAAAGAIDVAVAAARHRHGSEPCRIVFTAIGFSGQAATLALTAGGHSANREAAA